MTIYTNCILSDPSPDDGLRVSVMSRHTLEDGLTVDLRISSDKFQIHELILAPPPKLIGAYFRKEIGWTEYTEQYLKHLRTKRIAPLVEDYAHRGITRDITFLCIEPNATYCHRRLLAEECQRYESSLEVFHRILIQ